MKTSTTTVQAPASPSRSYPVGAEVTPAGTHFRVWAPKRTKMAVVFDDGHPEVILECEQGGYFSGLAPGVREGARYKFRLDDDELLCPDPASRYQPNGPNESSEVVDPTQFEWTDGQWKGVSAHGQVLYEMHIGTFTTEGTWAAAMKELRELKEAGITCLEVMPVPEFAGKRGWGYDGVTLWAPYHHYGTPDDFRRFVDAAHAVGLGVILDVVYNHFGPDGNYVRQFSEDYFNSEHMTDWGEAINFDGPDCDGVREFFIGNAVHLIREYHLDGFRFDATQAIVDRSGDHILSVINREVRKAAGEKSLYLINENEPQHTKLVRPVDHGGYGLDALWNDDFHHSAMVALTGRSEAYYTDYRGSAQELISAAKYGYLFQGQRYKWQEKRRGTPALDLPPTAFVHFLQNHDQVANSARGERLNLLTSPAQLRAMTVFFLLMPQTPMLFQGQEFAATAPFYYFSDHKPELAKLIKKGRAEELSQFPDIATPAMQRALVDPSSEQTFIRSKLDLNQRRAPGHAQIYQLHKDLLKLRREDPVFCGPHRRGHIDGAVLGDDTLILRFFAAGPGQSDRLLLLNLGRDMDLNPAPEPLLAPPLGTRWKVLLSSEDPIYGGTGTAAPTTEKEGWLLTGRSGVVLIPAPVPEAAVETRVVRGGSAQEAKRRQEQKDQQA